MKRIQRSAIFALAMSMTLGLSACGTGGSPEGPKPDPSTSTTDSAPFSGPTASERHSPAGTSTPAPTPTTTAPGKLAAPGSLQAGGQWLYALKNESTRPVGETSAVLEGDASGTVYTKSTSQFMGCDGTTDQTSYQLDGAFTIFKAQVGLRAGTPAGIKAIVDVYLDDALITRLQIDDDGGAPLQVVLTGGQTLTFRASTGTGECEYSEQGYLVFGDAQVS